jgi:hypothetical protein
MFSQIAKCIFFHFSSFWPLLLSNLIYFLFILNYLKCSRSEIWRSTNHIWTLIAAECLRTGLCSFWWFVFFKVLDPSTLESHNFLNFIPFWMIFNVSDAPIGGFQILFGHQKETMEPSPWIRPTLSV